VVIHANAKLYAGLFNGEETASLIVNPKRKAYVHLISGELKVNDQNIRSGDALLLEKETQIQISHGKQAEVLVFDLTG